MAETVDIDTVVIWPLPSTSKFGYVVGAIPSEWKVVRILPGRLTWVGRVSNFKLGSTGYYRLLYNGDDGNRIGLCRHTLVATHYYGPRPADKEACHYDGTRHNDTKENLRWDTRAANHADKRRHGTSCSGLENGSHLHPETVARGDNHWSRRKPECIPRGPQHGAYTMPEKRPRGERHGQAKVDLAIVKAIRGAPFYRGIGKRLAEQHGLSQSQVSKIRLGRSWNCAPS